MNKPPELWKTTIVIYSDWDVSAYPNDNFLEYIGRDATVGESYCGGCTIDRVSPDQLTEGALSFFNLLDDDEPDWVDSHSVNCYICGELFDERDSIGHTKDEGGDICPNHLGDPRIEED